jgi:hypothetical protein
MISKAPAAPRVILTWWKERTDQPFVVYSNLRNFCKHYPEYNYNTLNNHLSKKKQPFENESVRIERIAVIGNAEVKLGSPEFRMQKVVRKVKMSDIDEDEERRAYWMSRPAVERIRAVSFLSGHLRGNQKVEKVVKKVHAAGKRL